MELRPLLIDIVLVVVLHGPRDPPRFHQLHGTKSAVAPAGPQLLQSCLVRLTHGYVAGKGKGSLEMASEGHGGCQHSLNQKVRRVKATT